VLAANHGHFAYGYCQTSHSSQSKSVRDVLVAQSADSFVASSREQFYVSCSRGKETIRIYTDNRRGLQEAVGNSSTRMAGVELLGLTQKELSSFMASELGAKQWRETVASRRGLDGSKGFVKHLVEQRKVEPRQTGEVIDWKGYIEMRRNLVGADGKSRSKGYPAEPGKGSKSKGKSWPKISQHSDARVAELKAAHEAKKAAGEKKTVPESKPKTAKPEPQDRKSRLVNAYRSAANNFKKVADKVKGMRKQPDTGKSVNMGTAKVKPLQQGNSTRAAGHAAKEKAASARKTGEGQAKMARETKMKQAAPRPPTPKK
jgi:hypothetical protein